MPVFPLRGQISCVAGHPMLEFCPATGVLTGIDGRLVELLIVSAVLQERNLWVVQVKGWRLLGS